jgi:D-alanyl-D-alanine dipeptidase
VSRGVCPTGSCGGSTSTRTLTQNVRQLAEVFIRFLRSQGFTVTVTSTRRSLDSQTCLWNRYQSGCSRFPAAPPGGSRHGTGTAFDLHLIPGDYSAAGRVWEAMGGRWGGHFADPIHFDVG